MEKTPPDAPTLTTKVRFPILLAYDADTRMWYATSLLTGATHAAPLKWAAFEEVRHLVKTQFKEEGAGRKGWSPKLDEAPECAFRDWVAAHFWGNSDKVFAYEVELEM